MTLLLNPSTSVSKKRSNVNVITRVRADDQIKRAQVQLHVENTRMWTYSWEPSDLIVPLKGLRRLSVNMCLPRTYICRTPSLSLAHIIHQRMSGIFQLMILALIIQPLRSCVLLAFSLNNAYDSAHTKALVLRMALRFFFFLPPLILT